MGGRAKDVLTVGSHGSTFGGNPLVCAASLAVLAEVQERDLCENARQVGEHLVAKLRAELSGVPGVVEVRGKGLLIGIELDRPAVEVMHMALDAGLDRKSTRLNSSH